MTIKQIEPLLQAQCHTEIWVFSPDGDLALDVIDLDPTITYQLAIDRNQLKLKRLKRLPHKVTDLVPHGDNNEERAKLQIGVKLGKGYRWNG